MGRNLFEAVLLLLFGSGSFNCAPVSPPISRLNGIQKVKLFRGGGLPVPVLDALRNGTRGPFKRVVSLLEIGLTNLKHWGEEHLQISEDESGTLSVLEDEEHVIPNEEIERALQNAQGYFDSGIAQDSGWSSVLETANFRLFKRRVASEPISINADDPVSSIPPARSDLEYMMVGSYEDISPRSFLRAQLQKDIRTLWDDSLIDMSMLGSSKVSASNVCDKGSQEKNSEDTLYYRTKWPWPLKDRDYVLARRCTVFERDGFPDTIVFVSKSATPPEDAEPIPVHSGTVRVDGYWCHSTFFSMSSSASLDDPGIKFVTRFCEKTTIPLPNAIIDVMAKHAEKKCPESIEKLCGVLRRMPQTDVAAAAQ
jgi:hypothetical protein